MHECLHRSDGAGILLRLQAGIQKISEAPEQIIVHLSFEQLNLIPCFLRRHGLMQQL